MRRSGAGRFWSIWVATVPLALWALLRASGIQVGNPVVELIAFTPYVALGGLFVAGVALALRNWAAAGVALAATLALAAMVLPRVVGGAAERRPGEAELRVLAANVHHGTADPKTLRRLVVLLRPDVLSVEELTPSFARRLRAAGLRRLLPHSVLALTRRIGADGPSPRAAGAGLYSRLPMRRLPEAVSGGFRMPRAALRLADGTRIRLVGVHPWPPTGDRVESWREGLASLPSAGEGPPWVLAGDFNATLDHPELRAVLDRGYTDGGDATGKGLEPTWPAGRTIPPLITIDHVLADRRLRFLDFEVEDLPGSDHRAVFAAIAVP